MADKVESSWEPGTLDNTRRNIGPIDENEAKKMMKKLGGEILQEKSAPIDYSAFPKAKEYSKRAVGKSASSVASSSGNSASAAQKTGNKVGYATVEKVTKSSDSLPELTSKERSLMDRLMMSDDYKIKANYGLFNFVRRFKKNGAELLRRGFVEYELPKDIDHLQEFITAVKSLIQICPDTYKTKIISSNEDKFRFLKTVGSWTMKDIKYLSVGLKDSADETTVANLIPLIRAIYKNLIKIYYLGETRISNFFKEIYGDLIKYPKFDQKKALALSKSAMNEWFFIYSHVIRGLYPLLMRMCTSKFDYFQDFFISQSANILNFLGLTKFDLLLPNKKAEKKAEEKKAEEQKQKEEAQKQKEEAQKSIEKNKDKEIVDAGLRLLDTLFPEAGFLNLDQMPDMYPYFQPLYQFRDGYNLLAPQNPLQITITLLRITEDFFQGCRNIVFTEENEEEDTNIKDQLSVVLSEWSVYREDLFEKQYGDQIRDFVNSEYSQGDFKSSLFGKRMITTMLWQTKYNFLPYFEFEQLLLEKPKNDGQYRPLCLRTEFMYRLFLKFSKEIDAAAQNKDFVLGIKNPWERYSFDIPNIISKRLDVLIGAQRVNDTAATNANLIKYALGAIAVLNWWINDKTSPAYSADPTKIYRVNETDGGPAFSYPLRSDQNKLFADRVKKNIEKQKAASNGQ